MAGDIDRVPKPTPVGAEMQALRRFHPDIEWSGTIRKDGMGPGTPEMTAKGKGTHQLIQDGRWIVGNYEQVQNLRDGTFVLKWELHWVAGWDPIAREYRATVADCYGHTEIMRGHIDGDLLIFETIGEAPARLRLTWDLTRPGDMRWRNEMALGSGEWFLIEEYRCKPLT
jgi:hypothetical protein